MRIRSAMMAVDEKDARAPPDLFEVIASRARVDQTLLSSCFHHCGLKPLSSRRRLTFANGGPHVSPRVHDASLSSRSYQYRARSNRASPDNVWPPNVTHKSICVAAAYAHVVRGDRDEYRMSFSILVRSANGYVLL